MTSSSNFTGDVKHGIRLRKINSKYFSLKWRRNGGENVGQDNNSQTKVKLNEFTTANTSIDTKKTNGFFKNIKDKLSIKNFYKSKKKIITMDSSNRLDAGSSSLMTSSNESSMSLNDEIRDRIGANNFTIANNSNDSMQHLKDTTNDEDSLTDNYLNFQRNVNDNQCDVNNLNENPQDHRINENNEDIFHIEDYNVNEPEEENNDIKFTTNLSQELQKLRKYGWYWGNTTGEVADAALLSEPDGAFLIRDSSDRRHLLTLSFKSAGKLLHARVEHSGGMFSLCNQGESGRFSSVPELIDHSMNFSKHEVFCYSRPRHPGYPAFPVRLTKPISRFNRVRSLQYLCRFVIRQITRWDNIDKLPLPKSLKIYIAESHY